MEAELVDLEVIRGIVLIALFTAFIGMWIWAWSKKRKPDFDEADGMRSAELEAEFGELGGWEAEAAGNATVPPAVTTPPHSSP